MDTWEFLSGMWDWQLSSIAFCALLAAAYGYAVRGQVSGKAAIFGAGLLLLLLALVSPVAMLGDMYLLSAHMLQHFLLVMLAPPLLLAGVPESAVASLLWRPAGRRMRAALRPLTCWILGVGTMAVWHIPAIYSLTLRHPGLHLLEHVACVATALVFWWPVFGPLRSDRLHPVAVIPYLVTACICCTLIGIAIAFGRPGLYPEYLKPEDPMGALPLIRNGWGISPRTDQQLGGLLMWVPCCLVYISAMLARLGGWYAEPDAPPESAAVPALR
jgi:cytochrome c oxidase assembly factor CtaG